MGQGTLLFLLIAVLMGSVVVVLEFICFELFRRCWDVERSHEGDLIDLRNQPGNVPAELSRQPSHVLVPPESPSSVAINDTSVSNCLVVVNLLDRNNPDDRGQVFVANMRLSAMPRIHHIITALEKDDGTDSPSQFSHKVRKWGLDQTVVSFNRVLLWNLEDARYDTAGAEYTVLGRMDEVMNDEKAVVLPVLEGSSPEAERVRLIQGCAADATCPIYQIFFTHLVSVAHFKTHYSSILKSTLYQSAAAAFGDASPSSPAPHVDPPPPPPTLLRLPPTAVQPTLPRGLSQLLGTDLGSRYSVMSTTVEMRRQLSGLYSRISRISRISTVAVLAERWLQRARRREPESVQIIDV
jgi:hypothetical protein